MSLLDLGAPDSMEVRALASLGLSTLSTDTLGPLGLCLLSFGSLSQSVSSPQFSLSLCSLKWRVADRGASPHCPLRSPFPTVFSRLGEGRGGGIPLTLPRASTCVDSAHPHPQLPVPPASVWTSSRVSGSFDLNGDVGVDLMEHKQERRGADQAKESDNVSPLPHSSE